MIQAYDSQGMIEAANDLKSKLITACGTLATHTIQSLFFLMHIIFASLYESSQTYSQQHKTELFKLAPTHFWLNVDDNEKGCRIL